MDEQPSNWFTIDLAVIVLGMVLLGIGIWIGFDGHSLPMALMNPRGT